MSNEIIARLQSEPGWKVVCHDVIGEPKLTVHHVGGWALTRMPSFIGDSLVKALPISLSGEILSDRSGFLGLIGPNDAMDAKMLQYSKMINNTNNETHDITVHNFPEALARSGGAAITCNTKFPVESV